MIKKQTMTILDGRALSEVIIDEIAIDIKNMIDSGSRPPHLAAVLIGDDTASRSYVKSKVKSCKKVGIKSTLIHKSSEISEKELLEIVGKLNRDDSVDGFIVQLPLPDHIDEDKINLAINPEKDIDGFHPINLGKMMLNLPTYLPATPYGILQILDRYKIETEGKHCVVIGRSAIVGRPMSILLSSKRNPGNCTVTVVHSRTQNIEEYIKLADILIAAIGKAHFVTGDMVKEGAVIIDVGINRVEDHTRKKGYRLVGDVDYESVKDIGSAITPVPGGVGPMTVTSLLRNTVKAAKHQVYPR